MLACNIAPISRAIGKAGGQFPAGKVVGLALKGKAALRPVSMLRPFMGSTLPVMMSIFGQGMGASASTS